MSGTAVRRQLSIAIKWLPVLVIAAVLGGIFGFWFARLAPSTYQATARLAVQPGSTPSINDILLAQQLATDDAAVAGTRDFAQTVVTGLGLQESADDLLAQVTTTADAGSAVLSIKATDRDPSHAAELANGFARALAAHVEQQMSSGTSGVVDASIASITSEITRNQTQIDQLVAQASLSPDQQLQLSSLMDRQTALQSTYAALRPYSSTSAVGHLQVLESAVAPTKPAGFGPLFLAVLSALAALLLAAGVMFVLEYLDDTIRSPLDAQLTDGPPLLATLPAPRRRSVPLKAADLVTVADPASRAADAYRTLESVISLRARDHDLRVLQVTATPDRSDTVVTAANLAVAFSLSGKRVILVDADLAHPQLHDVFDLPNDRGLTDLLMDPSEPLNSILIYTALANVRVVTTGPDRGDSSRLLVTERVRDVLAKLTDDADLVVLISSALPEAFDAVPVSAFVDATLLVVSRKKSHRSDVADARQRLSVARANVVGIALFGTTS